MQQSDRILSFALAPNRANNKIGFKTSIDVNEARRGGKLRISRLCAELVAEFEAMVDSLKEPDTESGVSDAIARFDTVRYGSLLDIASNLTGLSQDELTDPVVFRSALTSLCDNIEKLFVEMGATVEKPKDRAQHSYGSFSKDEDGGEEQ